MALIRQGAERYRWQPSAAPIAIDDPQPARKRIQFQDFYAGLYAEFAGTVAAQRTPSAVVAGEVTARHPAFPPISGDSPFPAGVLAIVGTVDEMHALAHGDLDRLSVLGRVGMGHRAPGQ